MNDTFMIVLVTAPSEEDAKQITKVLLDRKLAACVNHIPTVTSYYRWEGTMHVDKEVMMLIKTRKELFEAQLIPAIKEIHPYQVPEIIALPIEMGSQSYLDWIREETQ